MALSRVVSEILNVEKYCDLDCLASIRVSAWAPARFADNRYRPIITSLSADYRLHSW